jgi:hypothetical protein
MSPVVFRVATAIGVRRRLAALNIGDANTAAASKIVSVCVGR